MKTIKTIYRAFLILVIVIACTEERNLDFLDSIVAPSNVSAAYNITQDNTGLVTITPTANGANSFDVDFGDASTAAEGVEAGKNVQHNYAEGTYTVKVIAYNTNGDTAEVSQELVVSFQAPQNLVVTIENDLAISKQVNVTADADFAATFEFYSGEDGVTQPAMSGNIEETIAYQYAEPGTYTVKVIAKGGAIETAEYSMEFEVTAILAPLVSANSPSTREAADVISIFSGKYTDVADTDFNPNWSQATIYNAFDLNGDAMLQYSGLNYQGIQIGSAQDVSSMEFLHLDVWTADATEIDTYIISATNGEKFIKSTLQKDSWTSITIPMSDFTDQGITVADIHQFKFEGAGSIFIDNLYFYKAPSVTATPLLHDDFEGNGNITTWAGDAADINTSLVNPFKTGINTSATVLEYNDTGGDYANIRFDGSSNFNMATDNTFKLKIYVPSSSITGSQPNQISLKLQDGTANEPWTTQTEIVKTINLDVWQEISFDFENDAYANWSSITTAPIDRTDLNRVVIQLNSEGNNDAVIAYIDDFAYGTSGTTTGPTGQIVSDDFEGNGNITTWAEDSAGLNASFSNPFQTGINTSATVLEYDDTGAGEYANIRFDLESGVFDMTAKSKFTLKVYVESSSISGSQPNQISLKLQDGTASEPWTTQTEVVKTLVLDQWQEVTFDFANDTYVNWSTVTTAPIDRTDLNRVVIQLNSEGNSDTVRAYIDDINYHN